MVFVEGSIVFASEGSVLQGLRKIDEIRKKPTEDN